jgi:asparagine synthase (glutamine-hydrolysing)
MNGYTTKYILREAFKDILPQKIYTRKDKKGFPTPVSVWFGRELKEEMQKIITAPDFEKFNILDAKKVQKAFEEHLAGRDKSKILWRAVTLYFLLKEYFNNA